MKCTSPLILTVIILISHSCNFVEKQNEDNHNNKTKNETSREKHDSDPIVKIDSNLSSPQGNETVDFGGEVLFSKILPFNKTMTWYADKDEVNYEISLKRIDETRVKYTLTIKRNDIVVKTKTDTVIYNPRRGGSVRLKYGYVSPGLQFQGGLYTEISIDTTDQSVDFIKFSYTDYADNSNSINHIPTLARPGAKEPYPEYLKKVLEDMADIYDQYMRNNDQHNREKYKSLYGDFEDLLENIKENNLVDNVVQDTFLLDLARYYEMDSVIDKLIKFGFKYRNRTPDFQEQKLSVKDVLNFRGTLPISKNGDVLSNRFERFNVQSEPLLIGWRPGYNEYAFFYDTTYLIPFQNIMITALHDFGFEGVSHIITVWRKDKDAFALQYILDKLIYEGIGGIRIDTILQYDSKRNIIIGTSAGGDGGEVWGSLWIGIWELPRSLKIVYRNRWSGDSENFNQFDYAFISEKAFKIIEKRIWYENLDRNYVKKDSIISINILLIDSIINNEHIEERN